MTITFDRDFRLKQAAYILLGLVDQQDPATEYHLLKHVFDDLMVLSNDALERSIPNIADIATGPEPKAAPEVVELPKGPNLIRQLLDRVK